LTLSTPATAIPAPAYPDTATTDTRDTICGETIADPYRWLENDVRHDPAVADWLGRQNAVTQAYLHRLPGRARLAARIAELTDFQRLSTPVKRGGRYFHTANTGLQNQSPLYVRDGLEAEPRLLLDPNGWADDSAAALADWRPSPDGTKLLYAVQDGGTDWRIIRALDVDTGQALADEIRWAKFTGLSWVGNDGFLYSRFPEPAAGQDFQALNYNQAVYYHRLGTPQSADALVFATPDHPQRGHTARVTSDGRWAIVTSSLGTDAVYEIHAIDLAARATQGWQARPLVTGFEHAWSLIDGVGDTLWFTTNQSAPMYRVVAIDLGAATPEWRPVVAERASVIEGAALIGERLIVSYLEDAKSAATVFTRDGAEMARLPLAGIGSLGGFSGRPGDAEAFYAFSSFNLPASINRVDIDTLTTAPFFVPELTFRPDDFVVEQRFYASKDGTRVPLFLLRRRDIAQGNTPVPTLLYGYGGFDIALTPGFSASRLAWVEAGGAYAVANIRGGGEYGKAWHDGGRLANKQNVFDDFIAAGEFLKAEGIATADGLAIQGGSNGGLLVGAVVNQRPDLFAAGNAAVGVMDMLRFDRWTAGRYWVDDYGHPDVEDEFRTLRAYSPLHNIRAGTPYPALLVTTADTDDRVVPGHSFKYTAALQAAGLGPRPQLIRIETRAGHGAGKPTDKAIAEAADILAFLAHWTGLEL